MKTTVTNDRNLDLVLSDIYQKYREYNGIAIDYHKPFRDKTLNQLGFIFGGIIDSVIDYYAELGEKWEVNDVKENFYSATSYLEERLRKKVRRFNGEEFTVPKRLSEMDIDEASIFIDKCIFLIDNAKNFKDMVLRPELRYTWVRNITQHDIDMLKNITLPRTDTAYLEHTRKQACIWCGRTHQSEVHHLKIAGQTGTGYKADDWLTVPLCHECHLGCLHQQGQEAFEQALSWITKYITLTDFCKIRYNKWRNKC